LALSLLKERWSVTMLTLDDSEAERLQTIVVLCALTSRMEQSNYAEMYKLPPPIWPAVPFEENFTARAVPVCGTKHPFLTRPGSEDDIYSAALGVDIDGASVPFTGQHKDLDVVKEDSGAALASESFEERPEKHLLPRGSFDQRSSSVLELLDELTGLCVFSIFSLLLRTGSTHRHARQQTYKGARCRSQGGRVGLD